MDAVMRYFALDFIEFLLKYGRQSIPEDSAVIRDGHMNISSLFE